MSQFNWGEIVTLKRIICGGDLLSERLYENIASSGVNKIINEYGLTETTITSIVNLIQDKDIAIGTPIANTRAYVLDRHLRALPVGAIGELYIGGIALARGYLNQPN